MNSHLIILILLSICASICFVYSMQSGQESSYCQSENQILCKKCPHNAKCKVKDFECETNFLKNGGQCLNTTLSDDEIRNYHIQIMNLRKMYKNYNFNLKEVIDEFDISEEDAKAAILYDEDFLINSKNNIIRKPQPLNTLIVRFLFLLLSIVFVLVLLYPQYDKFGAFSLSLLLYVLAQLTLNKLIKGLL